MLSFPLFVYVFKKIEKQRINSSNYPFEAKKKQKKEKYNKQLAFSIKHNTKNQEMIGGIAWLMIFHTLCMLLELVENGSWIFQNIIVVSRSRKPTCFFYSLIFL